MIRDSLITSCTSTLYKFLVKRRSTFESKSYCKSTENVVHFADFETRFLPRMYRDQRLARRANTVK